MEVLASPGQSGLRPNDVRFTSWPSRRICTAGFDTMVVVKVISLRDSGNSKTFFPQSSPVKLEAELPTSMVISYSS